MAKPDSKYFCYITKKKRGLNNLWKCVTVKYARCYLRKAAVLTKKAHVQEKDSIVNEYSVLFYN